MTYGVEALRYFLLGNSTIPILLSITVLVIFSLSMIALGGKLFGKMRA
jgi:hypothetical protein